MKIQAEMFVCLHTESRLGVNVCGLDSPLDINMQKTFSQLSARLECSSSLVTAAIDLFHAYCFRGPVAGHAKGLLGKHTVRHYQFQFAESKLFTSQCTKNKDNK